MIEMRIRINHNFSLLWSAAFIFPIRESQMQQWIEKTIHIQWILLYNINRVSLNTHIFSANLILTRHPFHHPLHPISFLWWFYLHVVLFTMLKLHLPLFCRDKYTYNAPSTLTTFPITLAPHHIITTSSSMYSKWINEQTILHLIFVRFVTSNFALAVFSLSLSAHSTPHPYIQWPHSYG